MIQWAKLPASRLKWLFAELSEKQLQELEGKVISLSIKALPIYDAAVRSYSGNYDKRENATTEDIEKRICGVAGNDAILASLNGCKVFYQTNQLHALPSDWVDYDFVLAPSGIKLEVKTTYSNGHYCNVNKRRWFGGKEPDAIISLRGSILKDQIIVEFMGWAYAKEVKPPNFEYIQKQDRSYYRCPFDKLRPPVDIHAFLTGVAKGGTKYLKQLVGESA